MSWKVVVRPEAERDIAESAAWYDAQQTGLGADFVAEVIRIWDELAENPHLNSRRHSSKDVRWRIPNCFPYRVIYEVFELEKTVVIAAVLHAARHDRHWRQRVG